MTTIETTLTVSKRIGGCTHLAQIIISTDMKISDHFQIEIKDLIEISALRSGFRQDHRKVKTDSTDIKSSYEYRHILIICRMHAASFVPWA